MYDTNLKNLFGFHVSPSIKNNHKEAPKVPAVSPRLDDTCESMIREEDTFQSRIYSNQYLQLSSWSCCRRTCPCQTDRIWQEKSKQSLVLMVNVEKECRLIAALSCRPLRREQRWQRWMKFNCYWVWVCIMLTWLLLSMYTTNQIKEISDKIGCKIHLSV